MKRRKNLITPLNLTFSHQGRRNLWCSLSLDRSTHWVTGRVLNICSGTPGSLSLDGRGLG